MRNRIGGADWSLGSTPNKICFTCCTNTTDTIDNINVLPTVGPPLGSRVRCGVSVGEWGGGNGGLVGGRRLSVKWPISPVLTARFCLHAASSRMIGRWSRIQRLKRLLIDTLIVLLIATAMIFAVWLTVTMVSQIR